MTTSGTAPRATATIRIGSAVLGADAFALIAAVPLGAEPERVVAAAGAAQAAGARLLLGRLRRYGRAAGATELALLGASQAATGLPCIAEAATPDLVELAAEVADMLLVRGGGAADPGLLRAAGGTGLPCLLERTPGAALGAWLDAAGTLAEAGAAGVALSVPATSGELGPAGPDVSAVPLLRARSGLPVVVDPSVARGPASTVAALARAAAAVGADGVVVDAPAPDEPGAASPLDSTALASLASDLDAVAAVTGRRPARRGRIRYVATR